MTTKYPLPEAAPWQTRLRRITAGKPVRYGGLCLYPLLGDDLGTLPYLLLDEALRSEALLIEETGADGSVPELTVTNHGAARVLLLDGEELVGAKQNRIVNTSVLVDAHTSLTLPVSCVEAGRWRQETARFASGFASGGSHYNARGRQKKAAEVTESLARSGRAEANQARVWSDIHTALDRLGTDSPTAALHAAARAHALDLGGYQAALAAPHPQQVGAAFALGRHLVGVDMFDQARTLAALLPRLVASYALDALGERATDAAPPLTVVMDWLGSVAAARPAAHRAVGLGEDVRLSAPGLSGAALEFEGACLHLSAFQSPASAEPRTPRLSRPAQRRQPGP